MTTVRCFIAIECPGEIEEEILKIQQELKMALRAMPNTPPPPFRLKGTREVDKRGGMDGPDRLGIRWVRPAGFHLTLKFLGNVTQERLSGIVEVVGKVGPSIPPFMVSVSGVGVFPNARDPRVIWIGVRSVGEDLVRLQEGIEEGLEPLGFAREVRSFHPHFTLGRLKSFGGTRRQVDTFDGAQAPPFRVGKCFDMGFDGELSRTAHHPELVEGEAPLSVNPEQAPAFRPESRRVDSRPAREALVKWIAKNEQREYGRFEVKEVLLMKSDLKPGGAVYTPLAAVGLEG